MEKTTKRYISPPKRRKQSSFGREVSPAMVVMEADKVLNMREALPVNRKVSHLLSLPVWIMQVLSIARDYV